MEKEYICLYKRKLDDIEVTNGIQNLLSDFKNKLSEDFRIHVLREEHETVIKLIYRERIGIKCPRCNKETKEMHPYLYHIKCENCGYEEEDGFIRNKGME